MFRRPSSLHPQPRWKRPVYLACTALLGAMIGFLGEVVWLTFFAGNLAHATTLFPLHGPEVTTLVVLTVGGYYLGKQWWQWVYVDRRWAGVWGKEKKT